MTFSSDSHPDAGWHLGQRLMQDLIGHQAAEEAGVTAKSCRKGRGVGMSLRSRALHHRLLVWLVFAMVLPAAAQVAEHHERILPVAGQWDSETGELRLSWAADNALRSGVVRIDRRELGATGGHTWQTVARDLRRWRVFVDSDSSAGTAYEYRVIRSDDEKTQLGYWVAGREIPAARTRGVALVVVDQTVVDDLGPDLARFIDDLIGDGWQVAQHRVARHDPRDPAANLQHAKALRAWVTERFRQAPEVAHSLLLVGHVPVVRSGNVGPDGHGRHRHETDLYYADVGTRWAEAPNGELWPSQLPDLTLDLNVGRIDFAGISTGDRDTELAHLRHYLSKNHAWRHGEHGDLRTAYGKTQHLAVERALLHNLVGPEGYREGGHHDAGVAQPHLWGVDFGHWDGKQYPGAGIKPVFALNFGSGKQHFAKPGNPMTQLLAQQDYPLAVGWGARPAWWLQLMALGGSIGDVHRRTVNNGPWRNGPYQEALDYYPMGNYLWRGQIWINLLGDPTLTAYPLAPPRAVSARCTARALTLQWQAPADPDVRGYRVFVSASSDGPFEPVSDIITDTEFTLVEPTPGARYWVRSYGLKTVPAGSFYRYSQGIPVTPAAISC